MWIKLNAFDLKLNALSDSDDHSLVPTHNMYLYKRFRPGILPGLEGHRNSNEDLFRQSSVGWFDTHLLNKGVSDVIIKQGLEKVLVTSYTEISNIVEEKSDIKKN